MAKRKKNKRWNKYCIIANPKWAWEEVPVDRGSLAYSQNPEERWFVNGYYQVFITPLSVGKEEERMLHLSIKTHDRSPSRDWRDFQQIKNDLVRAACEAVALSPAESRLVDTSNQYHLWAIADPKISFPIGFSDGRSVTNHPEKEAPGAVQRYNPAFEGEETENILGGN